MQGVITYFDDNNPHTDLRLAKTKTLFLCPWHLYDVIPQK